MAEDHYDTLGVGKGSDDDEIRQAYRLRGKTVPSTGGRYSENCILGGF